jgi:hypothetical protein
MSPIVNHNYITCLIYYPILTFNLNSIGLNIKKLTSLIIGKMLAAGFKPTSYKDLALK